MIRFFKTPAQFQALYARIKLTPCPHCKLRGCLILHGYLYGYSEHGDERIVRGRRVFCSNRHNKNGCGKTFCLVDASCLPGHIIGANGLWRFLDKIKNGVALATAFRAAKAGMTASSAYRLFHKLLAGQVRIRSFLTRINDPPQCAFGKSPLVQTIFHLKRVFSCCLCPVSEFQFRFQVPFF